MRLMSNPLMLCVGGAFALLAACTDQNLDSCGNANRSVSLGNLAGNVVSGSYSDCIDSLQQELDALRLEGRQLQAEEARLRALSATLSGEERAAATRLASLNATQARLVARISEAGRSSANENEVARAVAEERRLRDQIQRAQNGVDQGTADSIAQRQRNLDQLTLDLL